MVLIHGPQYGGERTVYDYRVQHCCNVETGKYPCAHECSPNAQRDGRPGTIYSMLVAYSFSGTMRNKMSLTNAVLFNER
jgi:hypothetical protein